MKLVKCINCETIWEYIEEDTIIEPITDGKKGSITKFRQIVCPKCNSNAFEAISESKYHKPYKQLLLD